MPSQPISALERLAEAILDNRVSIRGEYWENRDGEQRFAARIVVSDA